MRRKRDVTGKWLSSTFFPLLCESRACFRFLDRTTSFLFHYILPHFTSLAAFASAEQRGEKMGETEGEGGRGRGSHSQSVGILTAQLRWPRGFFRRRRRRSKELRVTFSLQFRSEREREREREGESQKSVVLVTRCHCPAHLSSTLLANLLHSGAAPAIDLDERPKRATSVGGQSRRRERVGR